MNYRTGITRQWQLGSGKLTDMEAMRMHHLLGSTEVYLYDIAEGAFYPVTLSDNCEYKTFKNQGGKAILYTFTATLAQRMHRK